MFNINQTQTKRSLIYYCVLIVFCFYQSSAYAHPSCKERFYHQDIPGCQQVLQCVHVDRKIQPPTLTVESSSPLSAHDESNPSNEIWYIGFQFIPFNHHQQKKSPLTGQDKGNTISNWLIPELPIYILKKDDMFLFDAITKPKKCTITNLTMHSATYESCSKNEANNKKVISKLPLFLGLAAAFPINDTGSNTAQPQAYLSVSQQNEIKSVEDITDPELKVFVILCDKIESTYFNSWGIKKGEGCHYCKHLNDVLLAKLYDAFKQEDPDTKESSNTHFQALAQQLYSFRRDKINNGMAVLNSLPLVEH